MSDAVDGSNNGLLAATARETAETRGIKCAGIGCGSGRFRLVPFCCTSVFDIAESDGVSLPTLQVGASAEGSALARDYADTE